MKTAEEWKRDLRDDGLRFTEEEMTDVIEAIQADACEQGWRSAVETLDSSGDMYHEMAASWLKTVLEEKDGAR